ncbi:MAG: YicC family protein [Candidatus Latescibacteria bacterium]|nr:YicC family protein [Candidatus Latescibacterota bacterium]
MTGYGSGESEDDGIRTTVEIRSVNGRFCEVSTKLPRSLAPLEARVRERVQARTTRGTLSVSVRRDGDGNGGPNLVVDVDAGRRYYEAIRTLQETLGLPGEITMNMIAAYPALLKPASDEIDLDRAWGAVDRALSAALEALDEMKTREGTQLAHDLIGRVRCLDSLLDSIIQRAPLRVEAARQRLTDRVRELMGDQVVDPQRVAMEVALFADRCDITEECVRFRSHNQEFLSALQSNDLVGRRLNFLLQEMNREANTIGAKANDVEISHWVITIKEELEKLREQVQNIE